MDDQSSLSTSSGKGKVWLWAMLVFVLVISTAGGVYYWQQQQAKSKTAAREIEISSLKTRVTELNRKIEDSKKAVAQSAASKANQGPILQVVQDTYKMYLEDNGLTVEDQLKLILAKGLITQDFHKRMIKVTNHDPMTCSQNPLSYNNYEFGVPAIDGSSAVVETTALYIGGGRMTFKIELEKDKNWQINDVVCPKI